MSFMVEKKITKRNVHKYMHPTDSKIDRALVYFDTLPAIIRVIIALGVIFVVGCLFNFITNEFL